MTANEWRSVESLFHSALAVQLCERETFLESACLDAEIRSEVRKLLNGVRNDSFLESPIVKDGRQLIERAWAEPSSEKQESVTARITGTLVADRYQIGGLIGKGGHGSVFLATDQRLNGRRVVLKVLDQWRNDSSLRKRFKQEIEIMALVRHPAVVAAHDCGDLPDGQPFLVMDFVDGITLRDRLRSPIDAREVGEIVRQVGGALRETHRLGIFHRDLKPENIMLERISETTPAVVKLIDFGIAKIGLEASSNATSMIAGTTRYMAPEQFFGQSSAAVDVYSLAVICYEMLTGSTPFALADMALVVTDRAHSTLTPDLEKLPKSVRHLIGRALSLAPSQRPQDAGEFTQAVAEALARRDQRGWRVPALRGRTWFWICAALLLGGSLFTQFRQAIPSSARMMNLARRTAAEEYKVGRRPFATVVEGNDVWVSNTEDGTVTKLRASDGVTLGTFRTGALTTGMAFDGANIWVANTGDGTATKLRASDGSAMGTFPVGAWPQGVIYADGAIWVTNSGGASVTKLRPVDGVSLGTFASGPFPTDIAFDGTSIWVTNNSPTGSVTKLRASDGVILGRFKAGSYPATILFDGESIWTSALDDKMLTKFRPRDGAVLGSYPTGRDTGMIFDGSSILIVSTGVLTRRRPSDGAKLGSVLVSTEPAGLALDSTSIWITERDKNSILKISRMK